MSFLVRSFLSVPLAILVVAGLGAAPSQETVRVTGTVTDSTGGVLPAVTVDAIVAGVSVATTTTDANGRYALDLAAGMRHQLRVQLDGFSAQTVDLPLVTSALTRDFELGIAPINDTMVVTASRTPRHRATVTDSLSVFTADQIAALGSTSLADIVTLIPGLYVEVNGREGSLASLFSRGGESDYNHVLIDGVRVNVGGGLFDFSRVSAAEVERVEVVRGAQSALYGSDAIGSVVQIFTKRGSARAAPQLSGSIEGGSFNTSRGDVRVSGGARQRVDYQFGVAYRGTDGAFSDMLLEDDRFDQTSVDGNVGVIIGDRATLRTGVRYSNARGRDVGQLAYFPAGDRGTVVDTDELSWHVSVDQRLTSTISHSAAATYFRHDRFLTDTFGDPVNNVRAILEGQPGARFPDSPRLVRLLDQTSFDALRADPSSLGAGQFLAATPFGVFDFPFTFDSQFRRQAVRYQLDATWLNTQVLSAGYEYQRESDPQSAGFLIENHAYFAQQQFDIDDRWFVTVGGRVDDNTRFGTELSPKVSAGGFLVPFTSGPVSSVRVFANIGKGIKNPTFGELFDSPFTDGNPDLRPERARTVDGGVELTFDDQRWLGRVTYFDNNYEDQVAFFSTTFGPDGIPDFTNIAGSRANGVELEAGLQRPVAGVTAIGSYAFVDTEVVATVSTNAQFQPGQPLLRQPKHSGTLRVSYVRGRGSVHFLVRGVGQRHDATFIGLSRASDGRPVDITVNPGYTLFNLGGEYRVHDDLTLFLRLDNLTNEDHQSALGYPGLSRAFMVGTRFNVGR